MSKSGIYKITCITNNKVYIGQSTNIQERIKDHKRRLKNNKHDNSYLQNSWNKHGKENFKFEILEICENNFKILNEREIYWINEYNALDRRFGFNLSSGGGNGYSLAGKTEEEKVEIFKKMSITQSLNYSGVNAPNYGKSMSNEQKLKISNSLKGTNNPNYGMKMPEHSKAMKGKNNPRARKVICLNTLEIFDCAKYAGDKYNTTNSNILKCCKQKQKSAGHSKKGQPLIWMYYEEYQKESALI